MDFPVGKVKVRHSALLSSLLTKSSNDSSFSKPTEPYLTQRAIPRSSKKKCRYQDDSTRRLRELWIPPAPPSTVSKGSPAFADPFGGLPSSLSLRILR